MRAIARPPFGVSAVLAQFGTGRYDSVVAVRDELVRAEALYIARAERGALDTYPKEVDGVRSELEEDLRQSFSAKLSASRGSARSFYSYIRSTAPHGRCPLCLQREVSAVDHHLPRSVFPALSIVPANLVPICDSCNKLKSNVVATSADDQWLHPYFDDLGGWNWLVADLLEEPQAPLRFRVERQPHWDDVLHARVRRQFGRLKLAELYGANAVSMLGNFRLRIEELLVSAGGDTVGELLLDTARSFRRSNIEPWSVVALEAWGGSAWFRSGAWLG